MTEWIESQREAGILMLYLNRIEKKNAINFAMYERLVEALRAADDDASIRAVVMSGRGQCFTSGNDLADFMGMALDKENPVTEFLQCFASMNTPVIVAVDGNAVGIGATLLLHADLVVSSANGRFSFPFVQMGLMPEFASSYLAPRLAGHAKAFEWLVLGAPFGADEALAVGLINAIDNEPMAWALDKARAIAKLPPTAVAQAKNLLKVSQQSGSDEAMQREFNAFTVSLSGDEFKEAVAAFFEKRSPNFL